MRSLDWMADAVCAQIDPDLWFPAGSGQHTRRALRICATCPVRAECADHAQALEDGATEGLRHGAWGGLSARQRSRSVPGSATALRDQQIMRLSTRGMSPSEIAEQLGLSGRTVLRVRAANRQEPEPKRRTRDRSPVVCGTRRGYQKHLREGETPCDACRQANTDADRRLRNTGTTKARAA